MRELWSALRGQRAGAEKVPGYCTVLDLGTQQAKALVVEVGQSECLVLGVGMAPAYDAGSGVNVDSALLSALERSCDRAVLQAEDMTVRFCDKPVVPDWVVIGLPGSVTTAGTFTITHQRSEAIRRITEDELRELVRRAQRLALRQLVRERQSRHGTGCAKLELVEASVTDFQVDGRSVTDPLGFRGEKLTVTVFNAAVASQYLRGIDAIAERLGLGILRTVSGWQALAAVAGKRRAVAIDVGGTSTDVVLVRNGEVRATANLALGGRHFTDYLAETLDLPWKDAERLKVAYSRGVKGLPAEEEVRAAVARVMEAWLRGLEATLRRMARSHRVPHRFLLCGGGSSLRGLADAVASHPWMGSFRLSRHPQVRLVGPSEVDGVLDRTGRLRQQDMVLPAALAGCMVHHKADADRFRALLMAAERPAVFVKAGGRN